MSGENPASPATGPGGGQRWGTGTAQPGCLCRTIRFWDLEKFQVVSCIEGEPGPVRYAGGCAGAGPPPRQWEGRGWAFPIPASAPSCPGLPQPAHISWDPWPTLAWPRSVLFNPDGCCLYSGCQDSLRVYGWEPERCFDVVLVNWGKVADLAICNDQLVRGPLPARLHLCPHFPPELGSCPPHPHPPTLPLLRRSCPSSATSCR